MPESLLTILKFCFLALLYLFFVRVLRAVWAELTGPRVSVPAPGGKTRTRGASTRRSGPASRLRVVEPDDQRGQTYELGDELTVGRAAGCQVSLAGDTYVSQLHARVFRKDGQLYVEDLGSTNGTYLNRKKVSAPMLLRR